MCVNPGILADGQKIGCRKCWQCKERRVDDWVGRCIAESKTSKSCHFVTLTYGENTKVGGVDHERTAVLTYSDVQKFFKKIRFDGYRIKYFVAGEFGSKKGRAHWHVLLYWLDKVPPLVMNKRVHSKYWADKEGNPLGFVEWGRLTHKSVRYACKYLQKDIGETDRQGYFAMSKKPPLGSEYFEQRAAQFVEQGLSPQDLSYGWSNVRGKDGTKKRFMLGYNSAVRFCRAYVAHYIAAHGNDHYPNSDLIDDYRDRDTRDENSVGEFQMPELRHGKAAKPWVQPPHGVEIEWSEKRQVYFAWDALDGTEWFWSFDELGRRAWTQVIVSESDAERRRDLNESYERSQKEIRRRNALLLEPKSKPSSKREKRRMRDRQFLTK